MEKATGDRESKESGPKGPGFGLPLRGLQRSFLSCGSLLEWWSFVKSQIPSTKSQVSVFPAAASLQAGSWTGPKDQVFDVE